MNDEDLYLDATREVESKNKNPALWAKAMALSNGDQGIAKYEYIKLRVEQSIGSKKENKSNSAKIKSILESAISKKQTASPSKSPIKLKPEYIPVEEYAEFKGITPDEAIQSIRDGLCQGHIKNGKWSVPYSYVEEPIQSISSNFFIKLINGDFGLPTTYWLFGILGNILFGILSAIAGASGMIEALPLAQLAAVIYFTIICIGIWRAADKYQGAKVWAGLAKAAIIIGIPLSLWNWLGVFIR